MEGDIQVKSTSGQGTSVEINLPLVTGDCQPSEKPGTQGTFNTQAAVLVVEDNLINQEVAKAVFQALGLTIDLAESGEEGVAMASSVSYDLIFMDLNLPGISGWEATKQIRSLGVFTPVVALSADVFEDDDSQYTRRGIQSFITKPIDKSALIEVLTTYIPLK